MVLNLTDNEVGELKKLVEKKYNNTQSIYRMATLLKIKRKLNE
tara:strand:- start:154 stop:282 length:129 start_codon:yes stop_codon:yes gene_type:complete